MPPFNQRDSPDHRPGDVEDENNDYHRSSRTTTTKGVDPQCGWWTMTPRMGARFFVLILPSLVVLHLNSASHLKSLGVLHRRHWDNRGGYQEGGELQGPHVSSAHHLESSPLPASVRRKIVNTTLSGPPLIYFCHPHSGNAMGEAKSLFKSVLPEYQLRDISSVGTGTRPGDDWKKWKNIDARPYDVFLTTVGMTGSAVIQKWLLDRFSGRLVYISGENERLPLAPGREFVHVIGPVERDRDKDVRIYYLQMVWWGVFRPKVGDSVLFDQSHKPRNVGTHFLIYSQANCVPYRERAFLQLSSIGPVHHGGRCRGGPSSNNNPNVTAVTTGISLRNWWDNIHLYQKYRFCLVMEHASSRGYVTEKILMAFLGGCVPIYYGTEDVFDLFNPEAFVFYNVSEDGGGGIGDEAARPALERVAYLEGNTTAYREMLEMQPILARGNSTVAEYFSFDDDIGGGVLKGRIRSVLGLDRYEFVT